MAEKNSFSGTSTGQQPFDKRKLQERKIKQERNNYFGDFSGNTIPTDEQKKLHMEKMEKQKLEEDRRKEKRRRGFITRKTRGDFNV
jgi:hypothetical protein|tara:strand:- start:1259 stop:1516 length:258 start_codon:yes stop_codon:yes gene_type:complete